jgi:hypothetical protein
MRRPSPALVIACLALFLGLGGVGYAAATIGSSEIKDNSVRSRDIRNGTIRGRDVHRNTLTGRHIVESKLGTVPNADRVDGLGAARVDYRAPAGTPTRTVLGIGELVVNATCGDNPTDLDVSATTVVNNSIVHLGTDFPSGAQTAYLDDNDFDVGQSVNLLPVRDNRVEGTLTYVASTGSIVTLHYLAEERNNGLGSVNDCFFAGSAAQSG